MEILAALKQEEAKLQHQLTGVRAAITALGGNYIASSVTARRGKGVRAKRVVSAALRAHLIEQVVVTYDERDPDEQKREKRSRATSDDHPQH